MDEQKVMEAALKKVAEVLVGALAAEYRKLKGEAKTKIKLNHVPKAAPKAVATPLTQPVATTRRGPRFTGAGSAKLVPCPVTGVPNKHRRFSYLMPEARTTENLLKYKRTKKPSRNGGVAAAEVRPVRASRAPPPKTQPVAFDTTLFPTRTNLARSKKAL